MKKITIILMCALFAVAGTYLVIRADGAGVTNQGAAEAVNITITGKLSCSYCTVAEPNMTCTAGCCAECVTAGVPPLLTDVYGRMFILVSAEKGMPLMTPERLAMMGGQVIVKGLLVKQNGIQAIYVDDMQSAEPRNVSITGRLSCTFCTLADPNMGCTPGCCTECVSSGDSTTLIDASGNIYLLLNAEKGTPLMTPERIAMLGGQATVEGLLVIRNGVQIIYVDSMKSIKP